MNAIGILPLCSKCSFFCSVGGGGGIPPSNPDGGGGTPCTPISQMVYPPVSQMGVPSSARWGNPHREGRGYFPLRKGYPHPSRWGYPPTALPSGRVGFPPRRTGVLPPRRMRAVTIVNNFHSHLLH